MLGGEEWWKEEMREVSPFAGFLPEDVRIRVLAELRKEC